MKAVQYKGEIWQGPIVHPDLWNLLQQSDLLIELSSGEAPYPVVLGVPHHAGPGVDRIADDWINPKTGAAGRTADETTGLTGLAVFSALREKQIACKLVIAAHSTDHDPNKTPGCPYWDNIFDKPSPGLLLELHGAANRRRHALELSAGRNTITDPLLFGKVLAYFWESTENLAVQEKPADSKARVYQKGHPPAEGQLQNPALETSSLTYAGQQGIPALHLEMKGMFRLLDPRFSDSPQPSEMAWELARALAKTLEIINQPNDIYISGLDLGLPTTAFLTRPTLEYKKTYLEGVREATFHEMNDNPDLRIWNEESLGSFVAVCRCVIFYGLPEEPPEEYLWLIDQGEFIGRIYFLHWLNEFRLKTDGQVDYWIRYSKRGQGYGKLILRLLLERYRQLGLDRILISCRSDNLPSKKIIEANGGIFENEIETPDAFGFPHDRLRYWINIK